jgi:hypothetical protein
MAENTIPHKVFQKPKRFSNELLDFVAQCTTGFAKKRPTALQLLQHPFIKLAAVDACKEYDFPIFACENGMATRLLRSRQL